MKIIIQTRFSIYDPEYKGYVLTTKNKKSYKKLLFDPKRLNFKFNVFRKVTLPSILKQTNKNFIWYIYASKFLPNKYKKKLLLLTRRHKQIKCLFIKSFEEFAKIKYPESKYCTVRLDDDDGLNPKFFEYLNKYKDKKDGTIISSPYGRKFTVKKNKIVHGKKYYRKKIGLGLAAIGMSIYHCGHHYKLDQKYEVIYNKKPNMFSICCSEFCDTKRKG